ncbi:MAG: hypothetical protein N7Q72_00515, partial [Spiroplasma sp. Tabriz.8]|nr:hypothetical protein [Spiroplasma sp. Tabriz.8]
HKIWGQLIIGEQALLITWYWFNADGAYDKAMISLFVAYLFIYLFIYFSFFCRTIFKALLV